MPSSAHVVHEQARDATFRLPGQLRLVRPPAAQADLDVAARVDVALLDEVVHRRAVREPAPEDLRGGVGVGIEVDEPDRPVQMPGTRPHVRLGDRVVAAEHDRHRAGPEHLEHGVLDRLVRADRIGRDDRCVAVVDDAEMAHPVDPRLEVVRGRRRRRPHGAGAEARARQVGDELVERRADDGDVEAGELGRVLGVREVREREQPGPDGLVVEAVMPPPALDRIDHAANPRWG